MPDKPVSQMDKNELIDYLLSSLTPPPDRDDISRWTDPADTLLELLAWRAFYWTEFANKICNMLQETIADQVMFGLNERIFISGAIGGIRISNQEIDEKLHLLETQALTPEQLEVLKSLFTEVRRTLELLSEAEILLGLLKKSSGRKPLQA